MLRHTHMSLWQNYTLDGFLYAFTSLLERRRRLIFEAQYGTRLLGNMPPPYTLWQG
jgi:hypothetical protein